MNDTTVPLPAGQPSAHAGADAGYLLHAAVFEASPRPERMDELTLSKLTGRRMSRLERVLEAHGGALVRRQPQGLLAAFESAEAALLVAAEMQRRCAVIPQIQEIRIGLKIGLHAAAGGIEAGEATAARLATLHGGNAIVASGRVIDALPEALVRQTSALVRDDNGLAARLVDWTNLPAPPLRTRPPEVSHPARPPCLTLRQGERTFRFCGEQSVITIGRDPANDVSITFPKASRLHCRIVYRAGTLVLVDQSLNGTYLAPGDGPEIAIRKNLSPLAGRGKIGFGHSCRDDAGQVLEYEIG